MWELNQLIRESKGRKKEILKELQALYEPDIRVVMFQFYKTRKQCYHELWKTSVWKKLRKLMAEYFSLEGEIKCKVCLQTIDISNGFILHHNTYNQPLHLINPLYCEILHDSCHKKVHNK